MAKRKNRIYTDLEEAERHYKRRRVFWREGDQALHGEIKSFEKDANSGHIFLIVHRAIGYERHHEFRMVANPTKVKAL